MTETWYEVCLGRIDPVKVDKSTEKTVWINGHRATRLTDWRSYFPTWEEAHAHLLEKAERSVVACRNSLQMAEGRLGNVKGMKRPDSATKNS